MRSFALVLSKYATGCASCIFLGERPALGIIIVRHSQSAHYNDTTGMCQRVVPLQQLHGSNMRASRVIPPTPGPANPDSPHNVVVPVQSGNLFSKNLQNLKLFRTHFQRKRINYGINDNFENQLQIEKTSVASLLQYNMTYGL